MWTYFDLQQVNLIARNFHCLHGSVPWHENLILRHSKYICCFSPPPSPRIDAGGGHFWREMVVKITSSTRPKIEAVYFCTVLVLMEIHACGQKLRGDEKQLIDLEWPYTVQPSKGAIFLFSRFELFQLIKLEPL